MTVLIQIGNQTKSKEVYELCLVTVKYGDVGLMKGFLKELLRRDAEELSMRVIRNVFATAGGASALRRHSLLIALTEAMREYCGNNETLCRIRKNCFEIHPLRITAESLLKGTKYEPSECLTQRDNVETGTIDNGCLVSQGDAEMETVDCDDAGAQDERLVGFLSSFADKGTASVTVGYRVLEAETGERLDSDQCSIKIEDGTLSEEDAQRILKYLDALKIEDALPPFLAFEGDWNDTYILEDGAWRPYKGGMGKKALYLYCNFYSGIKGCRL